MRNYAGTCRSICNYSLYLLAYSLYDIAFAITSLSFYSALFKRILAWEKAFPKGSS